MTNVIPLKPHGEELNLTQIIDLLHALCVELQQVKGNALRLDKVLHRGPKAAKQSLLVRSVTNETIVLVSSAIDAVAGVLAELIVEATAELIAASSAQKTQPGQEDGRAG